MEMAKGNFLFKRALAFLVIDSIVLSAICAVVLGLLLAAGRQIPPGQTFGSLLLGAVFIAQFIYFPLMEKGGRQATFGKRLVGLRVCDYRGNDIGFVKAFVRSCYTPFDVVTAGLGNVTALFSSEARTVRDMISGTFVEECANAPKPVAKQLRKPVASTPVAKPHIEGKVEAATEVAGEVEKTEPSAMVAVLIALVPILLFILVVVAAAMFFS